MKSNNQRKKLQLKEKQGAALAMVVLLLFLLSITIVTFWGISLTENRTEIFQNRRTQAYYLAWSGANSVASYIIDETLNNPRIDLSLEGKEAINSEAFSNGDVQVTVQREIATKHLLIQASGTVRGVTNDATVRLRQLDTQSLLDRAIYSNSPLDISGMEVNNGDIQSGGLITTTTNPNASNYFGGIPYPNDLRNYGLVDFPKDLDTGISIYLKKATHTHRLSQYIPDITLENDATLILDPNDDVMRIIVDTMSVDGVLSIDSDVDHVELYVKTRLEMKGPQSIINVNGSPSNLIIYLASGSVFDVQAGIAINAYIIGPQATMYFQSNYTAVNGALITNVILKNENNGPNGIVNYIPPDEDLFIENMLISYSILRYE